MPKTLIESPFPSTAEVAKLGVSRNRVRNVEQMVFRDAALARFVISRKAGRKAARPAIAHPGKIPPSRD
jgi:hypothetical protein